MNKEEMSELEKLIDKRRIELLTEAAEIAEWTGTHEFVVEPMNDKMTILGNLNKLKRMLRKDFVEAFEYKEENEINKEQYEKDVWDVALKLGIALQMAGIHHPKWALESIEKAREILLKYKEISEEEREKLK